MMRDTPITPRMLPKATPAGSSRKATRHQSLSGSWRSASARMISDVACEPELPPELMMSGMKRIKTSALLSSASKCCMALVVSISLRKSAQSHPARLRTMVAKRVRG